MMSYEQAQKKTEFWHAYYENSDERMSFGEPQLTSQEFFEVWIDRDKIHTFKDMYIPKRSEK
tara:strand:+ start:226 stop:411 length:186 start_codon:yes stop_codon:yes gene_type:complete